jgi:hypothetical protein
MEQAAHLAAKLARPDGEGQPVKVRGTQPRAAGSRVVEVVEENIGICEEWVLIGTQGDGDHKDR